MRSKHNMSESLKAARRELGKTLAEFSELLEIAPSQFQKYLKGDGNPRLDTIVHIARRVGKHPTTVITNGSSDYRIQVIDLLLRSNDTTGTLVSEKLQTLAAQVLEVVETAELVFPEKHTKANNGVEDVLLVEIRKYIAVLLKAIKTYQGISLKGFAKELGISRSQVQDILDEGRHPRWNTVVRIADNLGIEPAALISNCFSERQFQTIDGQIDRLIRGA